jgi:hypothetical protein
MQWRRTIRTSVVGLALATASAAHATTVAPMNLSDLAGRAGRIFRGTVVGVEPGSVTGGGGEIPTVTYRLRVTEPLKGAFDDGASRGTTDLQMVGRVKTGPGRNGLRQVSLLGDVPALEVGQEYLLFTTRPSAVGLSTTVGLGQGAFRIVGEGDRATATNAFGNAGLFDRMGSPGARAPVAAPLRYSDLADRIRGLVGR